jgi:putative membrane protein insertion efficiency factor
MRNPIQWLMLKMIRGYQLIISPHMPPTCRYVPSCSEYGYEAVERYGALKGGWMATRAIGAESRQRMLTEVSTGRDLCPIYAQSAEADFRL